MKYLIERLSLLVLAASVLASPLVAQSGQRPSGSAIANLIMEDSLTPAKKELRNYIAELRDTLVKVQAVQARLTKARAAKMNGVVPSQGRELARNCLKGVTALDLTTRRLEPMNTPDPQGDQALHSYRNAIVTLREDLRLCAHFDSLTLAAATPDTQKLENIAIAASDAIARYDVIRDALIKLLGITLPVKGNMWRQ